MGSASPAPDGHRYWQCRDESCERFPCRIFKEGQRDGYELGRLRGHAEGYAEGINSCPRNHA